MNNKFIKFFIMAMAIAVMPLASCDKDDEPKPNEEQKHDPTSDEDQIEVTGYDALAWLQGSLVVVDENGEVARRVYGKPLDASQPDVISVPVAYYAVAEEIFLGWVAPGKEATKVEGGYDYTLTDREGKAQGGVSFRAEEGEGGIIARMTVAPGTDLKQVTEVQFVDAESWPENAATPVYEAGKTYTLDTKIIDWSKGNPVVEVKQDLWYCLQDNVHNREGILVWLCPDYNDYQKHSKPRYYENVYEHLPSVAEAEKVLAFFNEHPDEWDLMLEKMDARGLLWSTQSGANTTGNMEFLLNSCEKNWYADFVKCLDLDKNPGKICDVWWKSLFSYRYMHIRIVPPVAE